MCPVDEDQTGDERKCEGVKEESRPEESAQIFPVGPVQDTAGRPDGTL